MQSQTLPSYKDDPKHGNKDRPLDAKYQNALLQSFYKKYRAPICVSMWIFFSSCTILYNKWVLSTLGFHYPIYLTTVHLLFATLMTRILKAHTRLLDAVDRKPISWDQWWSNIVPVGLLFTGTLISSNRAYLYLSVSFIQMLKATTPIIVLFISFALKTREPSLKMTMVVSVIVAGILIASYGEILFDTLGFFFQMTGIMFEAGRLVLIDRLLSGRGMKMDPLCSLYYFAPVCAFFNSIMCLIFEYSSLLSTGSIERVGLTVLASNAAVAFLLNVSLVFLIGATSSLVLTLCGILKDILLVGASVMIFGNPVTGLQLFGYSITLIGLAKYKTMDVDWIKEGSKLLTRRKPTEYLSRV